MADARAPRSVEARALDLVEQAMDLPSEDRVQWIRTRRDAKAVRERAVTLLTGSAGANAMFRTGGASDRAGASPLPERIGAYRITGLIGEGGMGAVYRGERASGDFDHVVAIKVIRPGALSAALIERFRRERQTLARLAHPNIAQLFDGGETEAGDPYIVMEYVEGRPLDAWLAAQAPSITERLDLFLAAAAAVAFAHQNLVVHGDVTPANILVDDEGRPKLIDFGIARPTTVDAVSAPARGGRAKAQSLTPGYAAPERLEGLPATTLSDVYSLGKVLDHLMGKAAGDELRAIVKRATAADPNQRYSTVEALRGDVIAHRGGFPVAAVGGGRGYVFTRFVRRHRLAVGAATAASLMLVAAFGATLVANAQAVEARAQAEARFQDVRALAKTLMFDVYDEVSKVPGSVDARLLLARSAQTYLDSLAADPNAPLDVKLEAGEGYFRLGRVIGFTGGGSLGRREEGKVLFARSEKILEELLAADPSRADVRLALGHQLAVLAGESLYGDGDSKVARARAVRARTLLTALPKQTERSAGALAGAYLYEGDSYGWDNDIPEAGRVYEAGIKMVHALPPKLRDSKAVGVSLGGLLRQSGEVYRYTGDAPRAIARLEESVALTRRLVAQSEGDPSTVRKLIAALWSLSDMQRVAKQLDPALKTVTEAQTISRNMTRENPKDAGALESIALTGIVLAQVQSERGAHAAAVSAADEAIAIRKDLAARSGGNKGSRLAVAVGLKDVADVYRRAGAPARRCAALSESRAILIGYAKAGDLSDYDRENNLKPVEASLSTCGRT